MSRTLIRGATVVTMDAQGVLPEADILITDDVITEIAPLPEMFEDQIQQQVQVFAADGRKGQQSGPRNQGLESGAVR